MSKTTGGGRSLLLVVLAMLMLFYPVSEQRRQLPVYSQTEGGAVRAETLSASAGTIFQFMEFSRETGGVRAEETFRRTRSKGAYILRVLLLSLIMLSLFCRRLLPSCGERHFPIEVNRIHSREIILRYVERQDGVKI